MTPAEQQTDQFDPRLHEIRKLGESFYSALSYAARQAEHPAEGSAAFELRKQQQQWATGGWEHPVDDLFNFMRLYLFSSSDELLHASASAPSMSLLGVDVAVRGSIETAAFAFDLAAPDLSDTERVGRGLRHRVWAEKEMLNLAFQKDSPLRTVARHRIDRLSQHGHQLGLVRSQKSREVARERTSATNACHALFEAARRTPASQREDDLDVGEFLYRHLSSRSHANPVALMEWSERSGPANDEGHARFAKEVAATATSVLYAVNALTAAVVRCANFMGHPAKLFDRSDEMSRLLELADSDD